MYVHVQQDDDKDMEMFYFMTALDARLCSVKKESCCRGVILAVFVVEFLGVLVPMVAWGLKIVWKKFHEKFTQNKKCLRKTLK